MTIKEIYNFYSKLKKIYTINPDTILDEIGIEYEYANLGDLHGYYANLSRNYKMIGINNNLEDWLKNFTIFHEVAHHFHGHQGRIFKNYGRIDSNIEERDADILATLFLLKYEKFKYDFITLDNIILPEKIDYYMRMLSETLESNQLMSL